MDDDDFVVLNMKVEIKRASDGKMSCDIWPDWNWHKSAFWWEEGNASCDCNRGMWFNSATKSDDEDPKCGDGGYLVRLSNADTGELLYTDMDSLA